MAEFSDNQLVNGVRKRDRDVAAFITRKMRGAIIKHVMENGGIREDGEDCYIDSYIVLTKMIDRYDFDLECKLFTLLFKIAKKVWLNKLKKRGPEQNYKVRHNLDGLIVQDDESLDRSLREKVYKRNMEKLSQDCRQILNAFNQDMSYRDMAKIFDYTEGTLKVKKCHCFSILIKLVKEDPDYQRIQKENDSLVN